MSDESGFKFYSVGVVTADKLVGSDMIEVYPSEDLPLINGKIADHKVQWDVSLPNVNGSLNTSKVKGGATISARWLPLGDANRITAPDVVKNETVMIYRFADTNDYYWSTIFREPSLRRLETVCHAYGDLRTPLKSFDKNSSYWYEISTKDKHVQLHTSMSDREPVEYDIKLDTGHGTLTIKDSKGNVIVLDSVVGTLNINANTSVNVTAPNVNITGNVTINGNLLVNGFTEVR